MLDNMSVVYFNAKIETDVQKYTHLQRITIWTFGLSVPKLELLIDQVALSVYLCDSLQIWFLGAIKHLYNWLCPSVVLLVCLLVG